MNICNAILAIALSSTIVFTAQADDVYKWVDEHGVSHYGDESRLIKQHGAKPITVTTPKSIGSVSTSASQNYTPKAQNIRNDKDAQNINYNISILSPSNEQQIRANNGTVTVVTGINPRPHGDYSIKVFIDGSLMASANNTTRVDVTAVPRGEHDVMVKMICKNGKIFASQNVHFTVLRVAVGKKH